MMDDKNQIIHILKEYKTQIKEICHVWKRVKEGILRLHNEVLEFQLRPRRNILLDNECER